MSAEATKRHDGDLRNYALVTAAYWADTIADGAIRLLVLFYFYGLGYTPFQLATIFAFYEIFGIATNLVGGWLAARFGLKTTLVMGMVTQILAWYDNEWGYANRLVELTRMVAVTLP